MFNKWADIIFAVIVVSGIFVMVRPKSQGPTLVESLTGGLVNLVKASTGGGSW